MRLSLKVIPNAGRSEIAGWEGDALKVRVRAVPEGGKANRELCELLARTLALPRGAVSVLRGATARHKLVAIEGLEPAALQARLPR
jgi:hypothetical protein